MVFCLAIRVPDGSSSSSRRRPEELFNSRMAGHPAASVFDCRVTAIWLACRGLPCRCRGPGYFSLLAQGKVTKRKGPPDGAPSGLRPPGARAGSGVFRQGILPWRKTGRHPCRPPFGYSSTRPPRHTGTPKGESLIKSPTLGVAGPSRSFVGAHLCATNRSDAPRRRGRAQVRSYRGSRTLWVARKTSRAALL